MFQNCFFFKSITSASQFNSNFFDDAIFQKKCFAIVGRSNVGKSSLINILTNRKNIAHVSKHPGKTRAINFFIIDNKIVLTDLPGYGYAARSRTEINNWGKIINKFFTKRKDHINHVFCLIDSRFMPKTTDLEVFRYLYDIGIHFSVILTKTDKSNQTIIKACTEQLSEILENNLSFSKKIFYSSIKRSKSFDEIRQYMYNYI